MDKNLAAVANRLAGVPVSSARLYCGPRSPWRTLGGLALPSSEGFGRARCGEVHIAAAGLPRHVVSRAQLQKIGSAGQRSPRCDHRIGFVDGDIHSELERFTFTRYDDARRTMRGRIVGLQNIHACRVADRTVWSERHKEAGNPLGIRRVDRRVDAAVHVREAFVLNLAPTP